MTTPAAVESDLGWALGAVMRTYLRTTAGALVEVPGGPRGYQVLTACLRDKPPTQLALARRLGLDRTVMTHLLDDLEQAWSSAGRTRPTDGPAASWRRRPEARCSPSSTAGSRASRTPSSPRSTLPSGRPCARS